MSLVIIEECKAGDELFRRFDELLSQIYGEGSLRFVVSDNIDFKHLHTCLIALQDNKVMARLCVYINPAIHVREKQCLLIGNFECVDDIAVAKAILAYVDGMAKGFDIPYIIGPMNGSTWNSYRLPLTENDYPFLTDSLQPVYYSRLFQAYGFEVLNKYYTSISENNAANIPSVGELQYLSGQGVTVRKINLDIFEEELDNIFYLSSIAFKDNHFFSPISKDEFKKKYIEVKKFIDPEYLLLAEVKGVLVAFVFCMPDAFQPARNRLVFKTLAKHPACNVKGIIDIMIKMVCSSAYRNNITKLIHAYMHQENISRSISARYGGEILREYALYIKQVI